MKNFIHFKNIFSRSLMLAVLAFPALNAWAQQDPYQAHFAYNRLSYNPAAAGSFGKYMINFVHHQQWVNFGGGEPQTQFINAYAPVTRNHNFGLQFNNDKAGFEKTMNLTVSYAYTFNIAQVHHLSIGAGIGFIQKSLNGEGLEPWALNDPKVPLNNVSMTKPDYSLGVMYHSTAGLKPWLGVGMLHLVPQDLDYEAFNNAIVKYRLKQHMYVQGGIEWAMNPTWALRPSVLLRTDFNKYQPDLSVEAVYNQRFRGGLAYRNGDAVSVILGAQVFSGFQLGYSYDLTTTNVWKVSAGTHEIFLSYAFQPKRKVAPGKLIQPKKSPRYF